MTVETSALQTLNISRLESDLLAHTQANCPVVHRFLPGVYIREVTLQAGTLVVGHRQRYEHGNIVLTGSVAMIGDDGLVSSVIKAPFIFTGKPGRKVGYVLETCTWQNIYATNERDIEKLEATYLDKGDSWAAKKVINFAIESANKEADRKDVIDLVMAAGFTEDQVKAQSENESDQIPMPDGYTSLSIRQSPIEGLGIFLSYPIKAGDLIGPARLTGMRTPLGRYTNHSKTPNCMFFKNEVGDIYMRSLIDIEGCKGGDFGTELTIDYRQALALSGVEVICQQ